MQKIDAFGQAVETVLIKHGKNIINEQFILNRLSNSAIDIYTSAAAMSRASDSLKEGLPTADHEKVMAETWIFEAGERIDINLKSVGSGKNLDNFTKLSNISKNICDAVGVVQQNPLKL